MKEKLVNILITAAGSTNGVNVIKALRSQKEMSFFLVAVDTNPLAAGFFLSDKYYKVPRADAPDFIPTILKICKKEKIKIIIPTFSFELPIFAKNKNILEEEGIKMAISSYDTLMDTENKLRTYEYFKKLEIPFPKVYSEEEINNQKVEFPVIIRPVDASGSKNVVVVNNWDELFFFKKYIKKSFVQQFIKGEEYTIDGVSDLSGKMIGASPRIRIETKGGLAIKSITVNNPQLVKYAKKIAEGFKLIGPFNIQCIRNGKEFTFIEVNSRFPSGGLPLAVAAGLNMPLILIKLLLGQKIKKPKIKPNIVITRYWDSIFLRKVQKRYIKL